ncbi:MAG TPA: hypothetical protein VF746_26010 [Longimicrobium sp.]|jgi:hypothetical protein
MSLAKLYGQLRLAASLGDVTLGTDVVPAGVAQKFFQSQSIVITQPTVSTDVEPAPKQKRKLLRKPAQIVSAYVPRETRVFRKGITVFLVANGTPLAAGRLTRTGRVRFTYVSTDLGDPTNVRRLSVVVGALATGNRRGKQKRREAFYRDRPREVTVSGVQAGTNYRATAKFWLDSMGRELSAVRIEVPDQDVKQGLLAELDHAELEELTFSSAALLFTAQACPSPWRFPLELQPGGNFEARFRFGANLQACVRTWFGFDPWLTGSIDIVDGEPVLNLASTPFKLAFGSVTLEEASLSVEGRRVREPAREWVEGDDEGEGASEDEDGSNVEVEEEWEGVRHAAMLRGVWKAGEGRLNLWSQLPPDDGVICWRTQEEWLDPEKAPPLKTLAELSPYIGGWEGWHADVGRLPPFLKHTSRGRLLRVALGVDLPSRAPTDVTFVLEGGQVGYDPFPVRLEPVVLTWQINHPWDGSRRSVTLDIGGTLWADAVAFEAGLTVPDLTVRGWARQGTTFFDIMKTKLFGVLWDALAVPSEDLDRKDFVDFGLTLDPYARRVQLYAVSEEGEDAAWTLQAV